MDILPSGVITSRETYVGSGGEFESSSPQINIVVIHTLEAATIAALRTAANLAKGLCATIWLLAVEPVPFHFSMSRPHVPIDFLESRLYLLACLAGIPAEMLRINIFFCRRRTATFQRVLPPRSLIVLAGPGRFWTPEHRLARWLRREGHQVVFVEGRRRALRNLRESRYAAYFSPPDAASSLDSF